MSSGVLATIIVFSFLCVVYYNIIAAYALQQQQEKVGDHCLNQTCGGTRVSYPFKLTSSDECPSFSSFFELECESGQLFFNNATHNNMSTQLRVLALTNDSLALDVTSVRTSMKVNTDLKCVAGDGMAFLMPPFPSPYVFSDENKVGTFGCAFSAFVTAKPAHNATSNDNNSSFADVHVLGGCNAMCPGDENNPECGYHTCCVSLWPPGSFQRWMFYVVQPSLISNITYDIETCSLNYATIFHSDYSDFDSEIYGVKLKWALPSNQTSTDGIIQSPHYACSNHSHITFVEGVPGYLCSCDIGYTGDGYAQGSGCSDVDECKDPTQNSCIVGQSSCLNTEGNYTCHCNSQFYVGDGRISGSGCHFSPTLRNGLAISGSIVGLAVTIGFFIFLQVQWRVRTKKKYFLQNGGMHLQDLLVGARGRESRRLFKDEELKAATNNYSDNMKLGAGGFGTVFKGVLEDGRVVAIKKANRREADARDSEQFLNEVAILMEINHRNIVKLLGCCLETAVPLLVYEYVSNGNVRESLEQGSACVMGWEQRLKVARQTAEALAYLHGAASPPILHRDVKSANVLLDNNLDAKVADFGGSRLVPEGAHHVSTAVQGTIGYLDPEYFQTLQLTDKSDVYSLGVMLVELITGLKPVDKCNRSGEPGFVNLALLFLEHMQEGRGEDLIDPRLEFQECSHICSSIMAVASLARACLSLHGAQRPSMSEVAEELRFITRSMHNLNKDGVQLEPLLATSKDMEHKSDHGPVVANTQFFAQVGYGSNSMCIDSMLLDITMPR